jgi:single-strand DNA-binding protein
MGRIANDLEVKAGSNDGEYLKFSVAISRNYKNKSTGKYDADFADFTAFKTNAVNIAKFFKKGDLIVLDSSYQKQSYIGDNNEKKYSVGFIVNTFDFVPGNKKDEDSDGNDEEEEEEPVKKSTFRRKK